MTRCADSDGSLYVGPTVWCELGSMGADAGAQLAQGEGKLTYHDGTVYEGNFADGLRHGRGKLVEPCGDVYDGEWRKDKPHGQGRLTFGVGGFCEGEWSGGVMHGIGTKVEPDGSKYVGAFVNDAWHGAGRTYDAHGVLTREGEWRHGEEFEPPPKPPARKKKAYQYEELVSSRHACSSPACLTCACGIQRMRLA